MHSLSSRRHTAVLNIHDQYVEFQLDNGSTANILPTHVYVCLTGDKEFQDLKKMMLLYRCTRNLKPKLWVPLYCLYDWVSALVVAPKCNGDILLCINPKPLNEALMRNHYPTPTIEVILPELHYARIFSIVDAKDGFLPMSLTVIAATLLHLQHHGASIAG